LTNKYLKTIPEDSRIKSVSPFLKENQVTPALVGKLNKLNAIAQARGQSLAQMSLTWTVRPQNGKAGITSALIGASRPQQIVENVKFLDAPALSTEELQQIEKVLTE
jgi:L-glyceraldehyde 3-phosphate reductase